VSVIIFAVILSVLVVVHELGHFLVAKFFGIRVDEFGLGYPPRVLKLFSWKGTNFTLNWIPFGGFVKIFGENPEANTSSDKASDNFQSKNRGVQASVLVAGVVFNLLFAVALITAGFMMGTPSSIRTETPFESTNNHLVITSVLPDSPAFISGLKPGDNITSLSRGNDVFEPTFADPTASLETASNFIDSANGAVTFNIKRGKEDLSLVLEPEKGIVTDKFAVGISMDVIGILKLPIHKALWYGIVDTGEITFLTAKSLGAFILDIFRGKADFSTVAGPVGIVGMVGDIRVLGFAYLMTFTALISINLAIINLLPLPALDGGRILFVIIESITRRPIPPKFFNAINAIGFFLLILLMILVTIQDIRNLF